MASIAGNDLGTVQSERQAKSSSLFQFPMPLSDSDKAVLLDFFGVMRTISINGIVTGTNSEHVTFINTIEAIEDGDQGSGSEFVSSKTGVTNRNVFIDNFEWSVNKADVSKIDYSLSLIEGDETVGGI